MVLASSLVVPGAVIDLHFHVHVASVGVMLA